MKKYITLGDDEQKLIQKMFRNMELSARGTHRILKLARTIADLDGSEKIREIHLQEAVFYRNTGISGCMGGVDYAG